MEVREGVEVMNRAVLLRIVGGEVELVRDSRVVERVLSLLLSFLWHLLNLVDLETRLTRLLSVF